MFAFGNGHFTTSKQVSSGGHNLFYDNFFRIRDKPHILGIAREPVKRSKKGAPGPRRHGAFSIPASVCSPERSAHWTMEIHPTVADA